MITVTRLAKVYSQAGRDIHALAGVSLEVPAGSVHGVIGPSGAGKSTLVRCLALLDRPTSGTVEIDGVDLAAVPAGQLRQARRRLGVVFQHANLFDSRTVLDNVAYPLEIAGVARRERRERALELLGLVGLADAAGAHPAQLSGGQRQRVGIARALATDPDVLLCDEPTSALDPRTTDEILDLIAALKARLGLAVLVITHEMHVVKRICDTVSLLEGGEIAESGPLAAVVGAFGSRLSESLLALPGELVDGDVDVLDALTPGREPALEATARALGAAPRIVAGTVETLGGTTFHRLRLATPPGFAPGALVTALTAHGAHAQEVAR
ncbi:methionine ABC transporter ATP-binding protein [Demequina iriomotensis]|uniref:methionine ABC transporter ATP-binding protein n=1 Tax=Demequina iriomotensis TaxID=1536641 RepID=UPI00078529D4|nr:ATP-binding cassette domain-containing protein [Demequina iriomotensis]